MRVVDGDNLFLQLVLMVARFLRNYFAFREGQRGLLMHASDGQFLVNATRKLQLVEISFQEAKFDLQDKLPCELELVGRNEWRLERRP